MRRITREYEVRGMLATVTSYDDPAVGQGNVVNQVQLDYNGFGQLLRDYQAHGGAVNTMSTPRCQYAYAPGSGTTNHVRPTRLIYPDGRELNYGYGSSGSDHDRLGRIAALIDHDGATHLADYAYLGLGSVLRAELPGPQVRLDLWGGTSGSFAGLDRFGRVIDQLWRHYGSTPADRERVKHGYDRNSNRAWRENTVADGHGGQRDELYSYDGLDRLTLADRGDLNGGYTAISTKAFGQAWGLDPLGNWSAFQEDANGDGDYTDAGDLEQTRMHNRANEVLSFAEASGQVAWATPSHDGAGNMTEVPQPDDPAQAFACVYDAWHRLAQVKDGTELVAEHAYDGLGRRTIRKSYSGGGGSLSETRHFYYSSAWQVLEERVGSSTDAERQYVWGLRYLDELVLRDRDADDDGAVDDERLYALQDANFNVTAVVDAAGDVQERYAYTPYGERAVLDSSFSSRSASNYEWDNGYQGRTHEGTGLVATRLRCYNPGLGRFVSRDPLEYVRGSHANLYLYAMANPLRFVDPSGAQAILAEDEILRLLTEGPTGIDTAVPGRPRTYRYDPLSGNVWVGKTDGTFQSLTPQNMRDPLATRIVAAHARDVRAIREYAATLPDRVDRCTPCPPPRGAALPVTRTEERTISRLKAVRTGASVISAGIGIRNIASGEGTSADYVSVAGGTASAAHDVVQYAKPTPVVRIAAKVLGPLATLADLYTIYYGTKELILLWSDQISDLQVRRELNIQRLMHETGMPREVIEEIMPGTGGDLGPMQQCLPAHLSPPATLFSAPPSSPSEVLMPFPYRYQRN